MLLNVVFLVKTTVAGGDPYSRMLFVGANPSYTNANNLVLTSDASTGLNIAKQFIAQVGIHATHMITVSRWHACRPVLHTYLVTKEG